MSTIRSAVSAISRSRTPVAPWRVGQWAGRTPADVNWPESVRVPGCRIRHLAYRHLALLVTALLVTVTLAAAVPN